MLTLSYYQSKPGNPIFQKKNNQHGAIASDALVLGVKLLSFSTVPLCFLFNC
jgi:hypothetical protein